MACSGDVKTFGFGFGFGLGLKQRKHMCKWRKKEHFLLGSKPIRVQKLYSGLDHCRLWTMKLGILQNVDWTRNNGLWT